MAGLRVMQNRIVIKRVVRVIPDEKGLRVMQNRIVIKHGTCMECKGFMFESNVESYSYKT